MPSAGFELATKRPQTYALDRAATEVGIYIISESKNDYASVLFLSSFRV
jgi:hypothetical protein